MLDRLNALWFEGRLGYLERLSIASAMKQGHAVTVYSYKPETLTNVPDGADLRHASEVMDDPRRVQLFDGKFKALGSDFFRYELFDKKLGYWIDLDVILLQPLDFADPYVFGWEHERSINGAILRLPADSPMLAEFRAIPEKNWLPPFFGPRRRLNYYLQRLRGEVKLEDLPWGVAGPEMITYLVRKYGLQAHVQPQDVFYPLTYERAQDLFADASVVQALLTPETRAIHMWHSRLKELATRPPPAGSYIDLACRAHGVDAT